MDQQSRRYALEVVTGPACEPASLAEIRAHLRGAMIEDNAELASVWIPAAREVIEKAYDLRFISQTVRLYIDAFPYDRYFELPIYPVSEILSVKYLDANGVEQTLPTGVYSVDVKRRVARVFLKPFYSWPFTQVEVNAVRVEFVVGWANKESLPATMRAAILWQARAMYDGESDLAADVDRLVSLNWTGGLDAKT